MVKFLLQRPIAVLMAFTACFIVGLVTYFSLPVSLLPDIAIPQITIQVTGENSSARELENTVVTPVRRQLLQVAGLREIKSETRDGAGVIRLEFDFGVNTDLAFIEVNEKIDAAIQIKGRTVVFWLTNLKNNGTIGKSSIRGRLSIQAPGKLTDQRDGPKTKGMVTILPWARTN